MSRPRLRRRISVVSFTGRAARDYRRIPVDEQCEVLRPDIGIALIDPDRSQL